ncbi:MAG: hypothetical protein C4329_07355 [Chitinophagaceae bacterium]
MALGEDLIKKISKRFEPDTMITMHYCNYDLAFKTDAAGNAIQLFMGKANEQGIIKGDREGKLIKDHWERKSKAP